MFSMVDADTTRKLKTEGILPGEVESSSSRKIFRLLILQFLSI